MVTSTRFEIKSPSQLQLEQLIPFFRNAANNPTTATRLLAIQTLGEINAMERHERNMEYLAKFQADDQNEISTQAYTLKA